MENTIIKAISHKENLVKYSLGVIDNDLPVFDTEVFDMCYDDNTLKIWLEHKYEEKLVTELNTYRLKYVKCEDMYAIINILGYRICKDFQFFASLYSLLKKNNKNPFSIQNNGIGVQITVKQEDVNELIQHLHNEFIIGENL